MWEKQSLNNWQKKCCSSPYVRRFHLPVDPENPPLLERASRSCLICCDQVFGVVGLGGLTGRGMVQSWLWVTGTKDEAYIKVQDTSP